MPLVLTVCLPTCSSAWRCYRKLLILLALPSVVGCRGSVRCQGGSPEFGKWSWFWTFQAFWKSAPNLIRPPRHRSGSGSPQRCLPVSSASLGWRSVLRRLRFEQGTIVTKPATTTARPIKASRLTSRNRPRSPDRQASRDRRRRLGGSSALPDTMRHHYTEGQRAVLCVVAGEGAGWRPPHHGPDHPP